MHSNLIRSILSTLVLFGPHWFNLIHSTHFGLIQSTLILLWPLRFNLSTLVRFSPIWSCFVHFFHFGPNLSICSYSVQFALIRSPSVLFGLLWSYLVHWVHLVSFGPIMSIQSTLFHLDHFSPFWSTLIYLCALTKWEKNMFGLKAPILNPNLL